MDTATMLISALNDEQWQARIIDEIDALPEEQDIMTPYELGKLDGECGIFVPEAYFANHRDKCAYAEGFASIRGASYLTDGFLVASETPAIEDDYNFMAHGGA